MSDHHASMYFSALVEGLAEQYANYKARKDRFLAVFWDGRETPDANSLIYFSIQPYQHAPTALDQFAAEKGQEKRQMSFVLGLDLHLPFEEQLPVGLWSMTSLHALVGSPIRRIPGWPTTNCPLHQQLSEAPPLRKAKILPFPPRGDVPITKPSPLHGGETSGGIRLVVDNRDAPAPD